MNKYYLAETTTDSNILHELATDKKYFVRWYVASNSNTSPETLKVLATDEVSVVRWRVASNSNSTEEVFRLLIQRNCSRYIRDAILSNVNCPKDIYKYLMGIKLIRSYRQKARSRTGT